MPADETSQLGIMANAKWTFTAPEALELCLFHIVSRDHPSFSASFHGSSDPAIINHLTVDDPVVLTETHLIVILGIVVVEGSICQALGMQKKYNAKCKFSIFSTAHYYYCMQGYGYMCVKY